MTRSLPEPKARAPEEGGSKPQEHVLHRSLEEESPWQGSSPGGGVGERGSGLAP